MPVFRSHLLLLFAISLGSFTGSLDKTIVNVSLPVIADCYGVGTGEVALVAAAVSAVRGRILTPLVAAGQPAVDVAGGLHRRGSLRGPVLPTMHQDGHVLLPIDLSGRGVGHQYRGQGHWHDLGGGHLRDLALRLPSLGSAGEHDAWSVGPLSRRVRAGVLAHHGAVLHGFHRRIPDEERRGVDRYRSARPGI